MKLDKLFELPRTKETRRNEKIDRPRTSSGKSAPYRDFERFRSRDCGRISVSGSRERREKWRGGGGGGRRGEGIDYWSLCQANAISRIEDSIQGDVNIVPRMNDEFFASLPPPPDPNICPRNNMAYSHSSSTCVKGWREKKKKGYRDININSRGGGGSKFLSPSRNEIFRSSRNSWLKLRESKKKFY